LQPRKVFLSYRREDSAAAAGRLSDRLTAELGDNNVFMDVDGIPLGADFVERLRQEVSSCDALLAVIGPRWLDIADEAGDRRLDNPNDFVRVEIAAALQRDIPVIPILLDGTKIPRVDRLPDDLKQLSRRNALDVRHASFHADVSRLIRGLKETEAATVKPSTMEADRSSQHRGSTTGPYESAPDSSTQDERPMPIVANLIPRYLYGTLLGVLIGIFICASSSELSEKLMITFSTHDLQKEIGLLTLTALLLGSIGFIAFGRKSMNMNFFWASIIGACLSTVLGAFITGGILFAKWIPNTPITLLVWALATAAIHGIFLMLWLRREAV
jgi:TIR domain